MYLDYQTYAELSSSPIAEEDFASAEAWAEAELDVWTLNRLQVVDWSPWRNKVEMVMARLIDAKTSIEEAEQGQAISHFSNGQDTYTFANPGENVAYVNVQSYAWDVLPIELVSRAARYNGAN